VKCFDVAVPLAVSSSPVPASNSSDVVRKRPASIAAASSVSSTLLVTPSSSPLISSHRLQPRLPAINVTAAARFGVATNVGGGSLPRLLATPPPPAVDLASSVAPGNQWMSVVVANSNKQTATLATPMPILRAAVSTPATILSSTVRKPIAIASQQQATGGRRMLLHVPVVTTPPGLGVGYSPVASTGVNGLVAKSVSSWPVTGDGTLHGALGATVRQVTHCVIVRVRHTV
jgi:hypothetical protein